MAAARSLMRRPSWKRLRSNERIRSGVSPVVMSSAVILPEMGAALNPHVPQPQLRMKPSMPSTGPIIGA